MYFKQLCFFNDQTNEIDVNRDGKLDRLDLTLEMPIKDNERIHQVNVMLFFDVKLHVRSNLTSAFERME